MAQIYKIDKNKVWTGEIRNTGSKNGRSPNEVRVQPPTLQQGEFAKWNYGSWEILTEYPSPVPPPIIAPNSVTRLQFLRALARSNRLGVVKSSFQGNNPNDENKVIFDECSYFTRGSEATTLVQDSLNLTDSQMDDLFILAGSI